jgi:hypothetical protein
MHEFISSGINGLNMGVGGFTATHFTDLINKNQKLGQTQNAIE